MDSSLNSNGLFVDNLHALRIIDPQVSHDTVDLKDEARFYSGSETDFFIALLAFKTLCAHFRT